MIRQFLTISAAVFVTVSFVTVLLLISKTQHKLPPVPRVTITIVEGSTVSDINEALTREGILSNGSLGADLEGYLYPDTYEFFVPSGVDIIKERFKENFDAKILHLFPDGVSEAELRDIIITASLLEKEVPDSDERRIVAGIINKRIGNGIPLQIDASICYIKRGRCLPITEEDKKIDSLYNTYRYSGLPPGPISNPGIDAIIASINPQESPYLYYVSDPETSKTIFAKSLDEHNRNVVKYLSN